MERKILTRLTPFEYQHPFDRQALITMKQTPGFPALMRKVSEYGLETFSRIQYTGSCLKVTEDNYPEVYELFLEACRIMEVKDVPELYITNGEKMAATVGVENPMIVITSEIVDQMTTEELLFVFGNQLHLVKSDNLLYYQVALILPIVAQALELFPAGLGNLLALGVRYSVANWERMAAFSADRAGLLCCQDTDAATSALIKLAGQPLRYYDKIDIDSFKEQAHDFDRFDYGTYNKIVKWLLVTQNTHPPYVIRAAQFFAWIKTGDYQRILERKPVVHQDDPYKCGYCGAKLSGWEKFCTNCGNAVTQVFADGSAPNKNQCKNCGHIMKATDKFCTRCGTPRSEDPPKAENPPPVIDPKDLV
ncbi:MAG: M48 family metallopeptidase [Bacteroidota bacterium]